MTIIRRKLRSVGIAMLAILLVLRSHAFQAVYAVNPELSVKIGNNIWVSTDLPGRPHFEFSLSADPIDAKRLAMTSVVAFRDGSNFANERCGVKSYTSADAGATWKAQFMPDDNPSIPWGKALTSMNAQAAFSPDGAVYQNGDPAGGPNSLFKGIISGSGDTTWMVQCRNAFRPGDHPIMGVDTAADSKYRGQIYIGCVSPKGLRINRSTDNGKSFQQVYAAPECYPIIQSICVENDGTVAIQYHSFRSADYDSKGLLLAQPTVMVSHDGGTSWSKPVVVFSNPSMGYEEAPPGKVIPAKGEFSFSSMAYDSVRNHLSIIDSMPTEVARGIQKLRIVISTSTDTGATWTVPVVVDGAAPIDSNQYNARVAYNSAGTLAVTWLDTRENAADTGYDEFAAVSTDGGTTFLTPMRVSTASSTPRVIPGSDNNDQTWLPGFDDTRFVTGGDYLGLVADISGTFHAVWPDARVGAGHDHIQQAYTATLNLNAGEKR